MKCLNFLKTWKIAHRGLHDINKGIPENSIKAFSNAISKNVAIELDITVLKDGTIVCFHDKNIFRMTNINEYVYNLNYDDLSKITLINSSEKIPRFVDVLNFVDGRVPLLVEIKAHKNYKRVLPLIGEMISNYQGDIAIFSFSPMIVFWFKNNYPNVIRGQITSFFDENPKMPKLLKGIMRKMLFNKITKPDFISYNSINLPNQYADEAKKAGLTVISYTAFNKDEYLRIKNLYDNIVFEGFSFD